MSPLTAPVSALGLSYASGIGLYATAAFTGLAAHQGWIGPLALQTPPSWGCGPPSTPRPSR